jgi:hypothetical protein
MTLDRVASGETPEEKLGAIVSANTAALVAKMLEMFTRRR